MNFYQLQNERWCYSFNHKGIVGEKKNKTKQKKLWVLNFSAIREIPPPPPMNAVVIIFTFALFSSWDRSLSPHEALPPLLPFLLAVNFSIDPLYNLLVTTDPPLFSVENPVMAIQ